MLFARDDNYYPLMRLLAVLALLFQLQPLVGSVFCFHDAEIAKAECAMPHEERPTDRTLSTPGTEMPTRCASASYCAPAAPAVPKVDESFQITFPVRSAPVLPDVSMAPGEPLAPPFHPPRA